MIDLRTDAMTQPTEEMWDAMREADVGLAMAEEDESINRLQELAARIVGKESALFVPTGSMGNLVALMSWTRPGSQVIIDRHSHIMCCTRGSFASICGVASVGLKTSGGVPDASDVDEVMTSSYFGHQAETSLLCLESPHNIAGGAIMPMAQMDEICGLASTYKVPVHLDGARIFNATAALAVEPHEYVAGVSSIMFNLNKGLSAPYGAVICGSSGFVERCRRNLHVLGGWSVNKAGLFAAAGLVGLKTMQSQIRQDNKVAALLMKALAEIPDLQLDENSSPESNIIILDLSDVGLPAPECQERLSAEGILVDRLNEESIRMVTHRHIGVESVERTVNAFANMLSSR